MTNIKQYTDDYGVVHYVTTDTAVHKTLVDAMNWQARINKNAAGPAKAVKRLQANRERNGEHRRTFNLRIGELVERGYTFLYSNPKMLKATLYHHANNHLQDDIVFVDVIGTENGRFTEERIRVPRDKLLSIADSVRDVESKVVQDHGKDQED